MDFDELLTFLDGHCGKVIQVSLSGRGTEGESPDLPMASFSGRLASLRPSRAPGTSERWRVYLAVDAVLPDPGCVYLDRGLFESCELVAEPPSEPEERQESGTIWALTIHQGASTIGILFYV